MTSLIYVHSIRNPISVPRAQSKKISRWLTGGGRFCQQKWDPRAVSYAYKFDKPIDIE